MKSQPTYLSEAEFAQLITDFLADKPGASDRLFAPLSKHATITARSFLGEDIPEIDDIVQDTVVAVLEWLRRQQKFEGSLVNFTISVARNRCRNFIVWRQRDRSRRDSMPVLADFLAAPELGPLDTLVEDERYHLLQKALDNLPSQCRNLLHAIYKEERSMEILREQAGLSSIQAVYARRNKCLEKVKLFFKKRLACCSSTEAKSAAMAKRVALEKKDD